MKKYFVLCSVLSMVAGAVGLIGLAGYIEMNAIDFKTLAVGAAWTFLLVTGYRGLKLGGCKYVD